MPGASPLELVCANVETFWKCTNFEVVGVRSLFSGHCNPNIVRLRRNVFQIVAAPGFVVEERVFEGAQRLSISHGSNSGFLKLLLGKGFCNNKYSWPLQCNETGI